MSNVLSHHTTSVVGQNVETDELVRSIMARIAASNQLHLSKEKTLDLVDQLSQFPLGRFLLHNKGLNGYWTAYIFRNNVDLSECHPLEAWLLNKSLYVMARERQKVFQKLIQQSLFDGISCASVPCGVMDDFLNLDYRNLQSFSLTGIDLDIESIQFAKENAAQHGLSSHCQFIEMDAWSLNVDDKFDLLSSNGLNMYESSNERLIELYQNFASALQKGGKLILSFIPPPPKEGFFGINKEDFIMERAIFGDIVQINYLNFSTEDEIRDQLKSAGLTVNEVIYNEYGVAPVLVATKD